MFQIGEHVLHQQTGQVGAVSGYGYQLLNGTAMTTIKVLITHVDEIGKHQFVEDVYSAWNRLPGSLKQQNA
jgi:hypothetical protein